MLAFRVSSFSDDLANYTYTTTRMQLLLDRDPHGNVQVAKIETEVLLAQAVEAELEKLAAEGALGLGCSFLFVLCCLSCVSCPWKSIDLQQRCWGGLGCAARSVYPWRTRRQVFVCSASGPGWIGTTGESGATP